MAILLVRHPEYHEPPICHLVQEGILLYKESNVVFRFWHKPNSLTEEGAPELRTWQHNQTLLGDRLTNHAKSDKNALGNGSNKNC
jgi:hypothetical protein